MGLNCFNTRAKVTPKTKGCKKKKDKLKVKNFRIFDGKFCFKLKISIESF